MTNKLYGYLINGELTKISPNKELLQEILMNDYYEEAWYQYNTSDEFEELSPQEFWHQVKNKFSNFINSCMFYIKDLEDYYIE